MISPRSPGRIVAAVAALLPLLNSGEPARAQQTENTSALRSSPDGKFTSLIQEIKSSNETLLIGPKMSIAELNVHGLTEMCERLGPVWHFLCREKMTLEPPTKVLSPTILNLLINISSEVNDGITGSPDLKVHEKPEHWDEHIVTKYGKYKSGHGPKPEGDCEEFSIVKLALLREAGFSWNDLTLVVGKNTLISKVYDKENGNYVEEAKFESHAKVAVRLSYGGKFIYLYLDNYDKDVSLVKRGKKGEGFELHAITTNSVDGWYATSFQTDDTKR